MLLCLLKSCGSCGPKPCWLSELFGGPIPPVGVLKVRALDVRSKPFAPRREAGSQVFLSDCMVLCHGWRFWQECLSLSFVFWCGYFLIYLMCRSHSVSFWISFWETCSMGSCTFGVFLRRMKLRRLLCCHLSLLWLSLIIFISNPLGYKSHENGDLAYLIHCWIWSNTNTQ